MWRPPLQVAGVERRRSAHGRPAPATEGCSPGSPSPVVTGHWKKIIYYCHSFNENPDSKICHLVNN